MTGASCLVPVGWLLADHLWYRGHRVDLTPATVNTKLRLSVLSTNLSHPTRLFAFTSRSYGSARPL